ncbi:MAG: YkvA family protein [Patescibacteria group bacterium]
MKDNTTIGQESFAKKIALFPYNFFKNNLGKGSGWKAKVFGLVIAGIYFLSPVDVIPDFLPIIGQIDDLAVVVTMLVAVGNSYLSNQAKEVKVVDIDKEKIS